METPKYPDENMERNDNPDQQEFEQWFQKELDDGQFDKGLFKEIASWSIYDKTLSKEENFQNAYHQKVDDFLAKNLKNLPPEDRQELQAQSLSENKDLTPEEILGSYQKVKEVVNTRNGSTGEQTNGSKELIAQNEQKEQKNTQDFLEKLKKALEKDKSIAKETSNARMQEEMGIKEKELDSLDRAMDLAYLGSQKVNTTPGVDQNAGVSDGSGDHWARN